MNKHFHDAQYYLKRAARAAVMGIREEAAPVEIRLRELTGREREPAPSRLDTIREEFEARERRAEREAREAIAGARTKLSGYRKQIVH